ncbi:MAG: hypothetical protein KGK34_06230 [Chloroflexota bacterium]|nr:hypothetical protein [Chloroflexota bacterium]
MLLEEIAVVDVEPISRLALGRWATARGAGPERAALAVARDYLTCAATFEGEVTDDWPIRFGAVATSQGEGGPAAAIAASGERERSERAQRAAERRELEAAQAALAGKREELLTRPRRAVAGAPRGLREDESARIAQARGRGSYWRTKIRDAKSLDELSGLEATIRAEVIEPIETVRRSHAEAAAAADAARQATAQQKAAERERKEKIAKYVAHLQELYRRDADTFDPAVRKELVRLRCLEEKTYEAWEETPASQARHLFRGLKERIVRLVTPPAPAPPPDPVAAFFQTPPYGYPVPEPVAPPKDDREYELKRWTEYVDADGRRHMADEFRSWSTPGVKAVLRAAARRWGAVLKEPRRRRPATARPVRPRTTARSEQWLAPPDRARLPLRQPLRISALAVSAVRARSRGERVTVPLSNRDSLRTRSGGRISGASARDLR